MKKLLALLLVLVSATAALAHTEEKEAAGFAFIDAFLYGIAALAVVSLISIHYMKRMTKNEKKAIFIIYLIITASVTLYLAAGTVYLNLTSVTGGPVHWHADFEVWACGEKIRIEQSEGFDNKVGEAMVHTHDDLRIHVEGVLQHMDEASAGEFFHAIGGEFNADELTVPLIDMSLKTWKNGDLCPDGKPGKIRFFVNDRESFEFGSYVIAPYADVPPGDFLNITFNTG